MFLVNGVWVQNHQQSERGRRFSSLDPIQPSKEEEEQEFDDDDPFNDITSFAMRDSFFEDFEIAMKVVIVGNGSVGKSSMIQRFCRGIFTRDYKKTIGVDFLERVMTIDDQSVRLMLWDTAGQEEFDAITRTYYRGANACVLACSVTDKDSFLALPKWKNKVCRECGDDIPMILVANKIDLHKQAVVDNAELEGMARTLGIPKLIRTSVKDDVNVNCVFSFLSSVYLQTALAPSPTPPGGEEDDPSSSSILLNGNDHEGLSLVPTSHLHQQPSSNLRTSKKGFFSFNRSNSSNNNNKMAKLNQVNAGHLLQHNGNSNGMNKLHDNNRLLKNPVILKSATSTVPSGNVNNGGNGVHKSFFSSSKKVPKQSSTNNNGNNNNVLLGSPPGHARSGGGGYNILGLGGNKGHGGNNGFMLDPHHPSGYYRSGGQQQHRTYHPHYAHHVDPSRWTDPNAPFRLGLMEAKKRPRHRQSSCSIL